jgi:hypothetical protein
VTTAPLDVLPATKRRRLIIIGLLRASAVTAALVVAYYLLPLDHLAGVSLGVSLAAGLLALIAMTAYQVRAIIRLDIREFGRSKRSQPPHRCSCFCSRPPTS